MIKLTRLGGDAFILNADLIKYVEALPDTYITLVAGDRLVVEEEPDEVLRLALEYQQTKQLVPQFSNHLGQAIQPHRVAKTSG